MYKFSIFRVINETVRKCERYKSSLIRRNYSQTKICVFSCPIIYHNSATYTSIQFRQIPLINFHEYFFLLDKIQIRNL